MDQAGERPGVLVEWVWVHRGCAVFASTRPRGPGGVLPNRRTQFTWGE